MAITCSNKVVLASIFLGITALTASLSLGVICQRGVNDVTLRYLESNEATAPLNSYHCMRSNLIVRHQEMHQRFSITAFKGHSLLCESGCSGHG